MGGRSTSGIWDREGLFHVPAKFTCEGDGTERKPPLPPVILMPGQADRGGCHLPVVWEQSHLGLYRPKPEFWIGPGNVLAAVELPNCGGGGDVLPNQSNPS